MFNWLKRTNKDESTQSTCQYESNTGDCSLIQQLKEKQAAKKAIDNDIKSYESNSPSTIQYLVKFFLELEAYGLKMDHYYKNIRKLYEYDCIADIIDRALGNLSIDDVNSLTSEIVTLKQKAFVLETKRAESKALDQEIADIKEKLGIE